MCSNGELKNSNKNIQNARHHIIVRSINNITFIACNFWSMSEVWEDQNQTMKFFSKRQLEKEISFNRASSCCDNK